MLETLQGRLPAHISKWLSALTTDVELPQWSAFRNDTSLPGPVQLQKWCTHAKLHVKTTIPLCLGARDVPGLQYVDPNMELTLMRPVQQAQLRWALRGYQEQLEQEQHAKEDPVGADDRRERQQNERDRAEARKKAVDDEMPAAREKVTAAYNECVRAYDVHGFFQRLSQDNAKLDATKLPAKPVVGSATWKADILKLLNKASLMAHPDKHHDAPPFQYALASETFLKLEAWKRKLKA